MKEPRIIAAVTGTRADFGLLRPVMRAIDGHPDLRLLVYVTGTHLLPPAPTADEVAEAVTIAATIGMQRPGETGRFADAAALGRGVQGFAEQLARDKPDVVLVLGDRIEAFAAAAAASVAGIRVAHLHGGDRAEGIADEALRHAITKLAHIHLPATGESEKRIIAMGEDPSRVHRVGSPAIDDLRDIPRLDDRTYESLGRPETVFLLHPTGEADQVEHDRAQRLLEMCRAAGPVLALDPNHDPGREGIMRALESISDAPDIVRCAHLPRAAFLGLLRRVKLIVGNSSAGLIECAAIPVPCVNVGPRQAGREMPEHVLDCPAWEFSAIESAIVRGRSEPLGAVRHPYGDGRAGERTAGILAGFEPDNHPIIKRNAY